MTCAGRSRSRSLALPISARTRRTSSIGNVLAITPRLLWSLRRTPAGRSAGTRAIAVAHPRASASMAQPHLYVNGIGPKPLVIIPRGEVGTVQTSRRALLALLGTAALAQAGHAAAAGTRTVAL